MNAGPLVRGARRPAARPLAAGVAAAVLLAVLLALSVTGRADAVCGEHPVGCALSQDVAFTSALALGGYFAIAGWRGTRVLRSYFRISAADPEGVGSAHFGSASATRELVRDLVNDLVEEVLARPTTQPILVSGPPGTGKSEALYALVAELSLRGVPAIPISPNEAFSYDLVELGHRRFVSTVCSAAASQEEAEVAWRELLRRERVVLAVDDLDGPLLSLPAAQQGIILRRALDDAGSAGALVVGTVSEAVSLPPGVASVWSIPQPNEEAVARFVSATLSPDRAEPIIRLASRHPSLREPDILNLFVEADHDTLGVTWSDGPNDVLVTLLGTYLRGWGIDHRDDPAEWPPEPDQASASVALAYLALLFVQTGPLDVDEVTAGLGHQGLTMSAGLLHAAIRLGTANGLLYEIPGSGRMQFSSPSHAAYLAAQVLARDPSTLEPHLAGLRSAADLRPLSLAATVAPDPLAFSMRLAEVVLGAQALDATGRTLASAAAMEAISAVPASEATHDVRLRLLQHVQRLPAGAADGTRRALTAAVALDPGDGSTRLLWTTSLDRSFTVRYDAARWIARTAPGRERAAIEIGLPSLQAAEAAVRADEPLPDDLPVGVLAWLTPSIETPTAEGGAGQVLDRLQTLARDVDPLLLEQSLGRGFKIWAIHGDVRPDDDRCLHWLAGSPEFWYARLNAVHALAIAAVRCPERAVPTAAALDSVRVEDVHPFVRAAAAACSAGLREGSAWQSWAWEVEGDVVDEAARRLGPGPRCLFGDVVLSLNLVFSVDDDSTWARTQRPEHRVWVGSASLPRCIEDGTRRGDIWTGCSSDCPFKLCPYPIAKDLGLRTPLTEPFCRSIRQALAGVGEIDWVSGGTGPAIRFWKRLEEELAVR